jgi:hypothetical protein
MGEELAMPVQKIKQSPLYVPLYPPDGAPVMGFCCQISIKGIYLEEITCGVLCKNERNMKEHILTQHGIKIQQEFDYEDKNSG